jgi:hypothetical protein
MWLIISTVLIGRHEYGVGTGTVHKSFAFIASLPSKVRLGDLLMTCASQVWPLLCRTSKRRLSNVAKDLLLAANTRGCGT